ncbi:hypothetical protein MMC11_006147 [Xylographa trunciseda]|nr:hypothetical protein [Xylographa trunciseda]
MKYQAVFALLAALVAAAPSCPTNSAPSQFDSACFSSSDIITCDVAVIRGGSSGTYAAITLKDMGKSVVVVEKASRLGGHFVWYPVPGTSQLIEYGILVLWNTHVVQNFFARLTSPPKPSSHPKPLQSSQTSPPANRSRAFHQRQTSPSTPKQVNNYPQLEPGLDLQQPVLGDFSLPFGSFVTKYGLEGEAFAIYNSASTGGLYNILQEPTYNVFHSFNQIAFSKAAGQALVANYSELFSEATAALGSSVLLRSTVTAAYRPAKGSGPGSVLLLVQTPSGDKLIVAHQILVTIPQTIANLQSLILDSQESSVFNQFANDYLHTGLVNNTGLTAGSNYINAGANTLYHIPNQPSVAHFMPTAAAGIYSFCYTAGSAASRATVQQAVTSVVSELTGTSSSPQIVALADHLPYNLGVSSSATSIGFYNQLKALQRHRNTWYTGAVFSASSGALWTFTQSLLQQLVPAI